MAITSNLAGLHASPAFTADCDPPALSGSVPSSLVSAPGAVFGPIDPSWLGLMGGQFADGFGDLTWFERVHVEPYYRDLGFVISAQTIVVRVWNASRFAEIVAYGAEVRGDEGASLDDPGPFPLVFLPGRQRSFDLIVSEDGPPQFANQVVFFFPGVADAEADFNLIGIRVVPFPIDPSGDIVEGYGYLTRVISSMSDDEQRAALRDVPVRSWTFDFVLSGRDTRLARSLLYGWSAQPFGVPIWYEETRLTSNASAGALSISADTTERDWLDLGLLWVSPWQWEAVLIDAVASGSLTLGSALLADWPAGSKLYPMRLARVEARQIFNRRNLENAVSRITFRGEDYTR